MKVWKFIGLVVLLMASSAIIALAVPEGPDTVTINSNERRSTTNNSYTVEAMAGNVTQLIIDEVTITNKWQGYYGNITGTITLDDADNNTLYDWSLGNPSGEIFASNGSSVTWDDIKCFNFTANNSDDDGFTMNLTTLETAYDDNSGARDGVDETFNQTFSGSFTVGSVTINSGGGCPQTNLYENDAYQTNNFTEVILTDNVSVVYTAILEADELGFDDTTYDFQMIVGENGNASGATNYYFYVELN